MINALTNASAGLARASAQIDAAAGQVAQGGDADLADAAVNLIQGGAAYKADIAVLKMTETMDAQITRLFDRTV